MRVNVRGQAEGGEKRSAGVYAAAMRGGRGETRVRGRDSVRREKGGRIGMEGQRVRRVAILREKEGRKGS